MPSSTRPLAPPPEAAVLLVLLPSEGTVPQVRAGTLAALARLQGELGAAIRVLVVDEAGHPAVVHAFDGRGVPAFVLMRQGVELWRQQGLPEGETTAAVLLARLANAPA